MNYTTWEEIIQEADVPVEGDALSVYRAFEQVQDGRHKRGVRYSVALILTLIVLAKLAGMTTPGAIAEWVRLRAGWLRKVLPGTRESFPCAATYSNVLQGLDAKPGERGSHAVGDAGKGDEALWRRTEPPAGASRTRRACACRFGWQDAPWDVGA